MGVCGPVVGVLFAPLARALATLFGIGEIAGEFGAPIVGAALPLTFGAAADELTGMAFGGLKGMLAIGTSARRHGVTSC